MKHLRPFGVRDYFIFIPKRPCMLINLISLHYFVVDFKFLHQLIFILETGRNYVMPGKVDFHFPEVSLLWYISD